MKKLLSVMLSLLMILSVLSFGAFAADCDHSSLVSGIVEKEPTCVTTGVKKAWCGVCQSYVYLTIPVTEHSWEWTIRKGYEPTLYKTGLKDGVCTVCKKTQTGVVVPKLECSVHSVDSFEKTAEWTVITEPTCVSVGKKQAWCSGCEKFIVRDIPMNDHSPVTIKGVEPTCEEYGTVEGLYCYVCETYLVHPEKIRPLGHKMVLRHGMYDIEPTCTEKGKGTMICLNDGCEYTETIEVNTISHVDSDGDQFCDMCEGRICKCICHKDSFISRFIRKLNTLLQKLLKSEDIPFRCCECMEPLDF